MFYATLAILITFLYDKFCLGIRNCTVNRGSCFTSWWPIFWDKVSCNDFTFSYIKFRELQEVLQPLDYNCYKDCKIEHKEKIRSLLLSSTMLNCHNAREMISAKCNVVIGAVFGKNKWDNAKTSSTTVSVSLEERAQYSSLWYLNYCSYATGYFGWSNRAFVREFIRYAALLFLFLFYWYMYYWGK